MGFTKTVLEPLRHNRAAFKISNDSIVRILELTIGYGCPFFSDVFAANTLMKSLASLSYPPVVQNNKERTFKLRKNNLRKTQNCL